MKETNDEEFSNQGNDVERVDLGTPWSDIDEFGSENMKCEKEQKLRLQFHFDAKNNLLKEVKFDLVVVFGNAYGSKNTNGLFNDISIFVDVFTMPSN